LNRFLSKDFLSGVMFIAFGAGALYLGRHLAVGTTVRMGPGWVPHALAYVMLGLGAIISVVALVTPGDVTEAPKWRPITMVTIGLVAFALLLEPSNVWPVTGLIPALIALILLASLGGDEFKIIEVVANIVVLSILSLLVFWVGLRMNIGILYIGSTDVGAIVLEPVRSGIYYLFGLIASAFDYVRSLVESLFQARVGVR
jgi:hypothetical protein